MPIVVERKGGDRPHPFTICIVANPALPHSLAAAAPVTRDSIMDLPSLFHSAVEYIEANVFGTLPKQVEPGLGDPRIAPYVRLVSVFEDAEPTDANRLIDFAEGFTVSPREETLLPFVASRHIDADVIYVVTGDETFARASAIPSVDDPEQGGEVYTLDGVEHRHCYFARRPGMVAIQAEARDHVALHEFQHAIGTLDVACLLDDISNRGALAVNRRLGHLTQHFCNYNGTDYRSDPNRAPAGYPAGWGAFHCERFNTNELAIMDDFSRFGTPIAAENDKITRAFVTDRMVAKVAR
jgi:hypothetical protein